MPKHLPKQLFFLLLTIFLLGCRPLREAPFSAELKPGFEWLFNGENLEGWYPVIDDKGTEKDLFTARQGVLHVYKDQTAGSAQSFGGLITRKEYSDFVLTFDYKWGVKKFRPRHEFVRDAGVIFHMHGEDIIWPNGVECQIQEGDTGDLWLIGTRASSKVQSVIRNYAPDGRLETRGEEGQRFSRFHRAYSWEIPGWNHVELRVSKDQAKFIVNGHLVNEAIDMKYWNEVEEAWRPLTSGKILFQAEGAEIFYRNIQIKDNS